MMRALRKALERRMSMVRAEPDAGLSLMEVVMALVLSTVVLGIVGSLLFQTFNVQTRVRTSATAVNEGQTVLSSIQAKLRPSTVLTSTADASGVLLVAQTKNAAGVTSCGYRAYYFKYGNGGAIYTKSSTSAITAPSSAQLASWLTMITGVSKVGSDLPFSLGTGTTAAVATIHFYVTVSGASPIEFKSSAVSRQTKLESSQC
jgi:hypothetical protein